MILAMFLVGLLAFAGALCFALSAVEQVDLSGTIFCGVLSLIFFMFGAIVWLGADVVSLLGMRHIDAFAQSQEEGSD